MRPLIVVLVVIAAWQLVDGAAPERPPSEYLAAVSIRVPPSTAEAPVSLQPNSCDEVERPILLSTGPGLELGRRRDFGDRGAEPGQPLHGACAQPRPGLVP